MSVLKVTALNSQDTRNKIARSAPVFTKPRVQKIAYQKIITQLYSIRLKINKKKLMQQMHILQ